MKLIDVKIICLFIHLYILIPFDFIRYHFIDWLFMALNILNLLCFFLLAIDGFSTFLKDTLRELKENRPKF